MFRSFSRQLMRATPAMLNIPSGFEVLPSRVVDKDINSSYEQLNTMKFTLTRQDEVIMKEHEVKSVRLSTADGSIEVHPSHEYEIAQLVPATIFIEEKDGRTTKYFATGGFAHINNEGSMDVNTVECLPFADFDVSVAEKELVKANDTLKNAKNDKEKAIAEVQVEALDALVTAIKAA